MRRSRGHNLLEVIVATGIFVLISVALSGIWVMYGKALAKSGEHLAANQLARGVTEGLISNGFEWMRTQATTVTMPVEDTYTMVRQVRGREASIKYSLSPLSHHGPEHLRRYLSRGSHGPMEVRDRQ